MLQIYIASPVISIVCCITSVLVVYKFVPVSDCRYYACRLCVTVHNAVSRSVLPLDYTHSRSGVDEGPSVQEQSLFGKLLG